MILGFLAGAYCVTTYVVMFGNAGAACRSDLDLKARFYHGAVFLLAPVTAPISFATLMIVNNINFRSKI